LPRREAGKGGGGDILKDTHKDSLYAKRKGQDGTFTQSGISHYVGLSLDAAEQHQVCWVSIQGILLV
jgi:hypothetical protein